MFRMLYILAFSILFINSSCSTYENITENGSIITIDKGHLRVGRYRNIISTGKKIETDTTTGNIISITKYKIEQGCFAPRRIIERKQVFIEGKRSHKWEKDKHEFNYH